MVIQRGEVWWADLAGIRRPLLIVQADSFNRSYIETAIAVVLTSNLRLLDAPGNVLVARRASGLAKDSVANVSQIVTIDRDILIDRAGKLPAETMSAVDAGLRLVLSV